MAAVMKTSGLAGLLTGAVALGVAELTAAATLAAAPRTARRRGTARRRKKARRGKARRGRWAGSGGSCLVWYVAASTRRSIRAGGVTAQARASLAVVSRRPRTSAAQVGQCCRWRSNSSRSVSLTASRT